VKWWRKAADQGDEFAQSNLGVAYEKGQGGSFSGSTSSRFRSINSLPLTLYQRQIEGIISMNIEKYSVVILSAFLVGCSGGDAPAVSLDKAPSKMTAAELGDAAAYSACTLAAFLAEPTPVFNTQEERSNYESSIRVNVRLHDSLFNEIYDAMDSISSQFDSINDGGAADYSCGLPPPFPQRIEDTGRIRGVCGIPITALNGKPLQFSPKDGVMTALTLGEASGYVGTPVPRIPWRASFAKTDYSRSVDRGLEKYCKASRQQIIEAICVVDDGFWRFTYMRRIWSDDLGISKKNTCGAQSAANASRTNDSSAEQEEPPIEAEPATPAAAEPAPAADEDYR